MAAMARACTDWYSANHGLEPICAAAGRMAKSEPDKQGEGHENDQQPRQPLARHRPQ